MALGNLYNFIVTIEMYLSHLKLYGWYEQYGKCSYIISGFLGCILVVMVCALMFFVYFIVHTFGICIVASL